MKNLMIAAVCAACISSPALAEGEVVPVVAETGLLPYGIGLTVESDIFYALDAETFTSEPSVTIDWMNMYVGLKPTIDVSEFEIENIELQVGLNTDLFGVTLNPYTKVNMDDSGGYQDAVIGVKKSMKF